MSALMYGTTLICVNSDVDSKVWSTDDGTSGVTSIIRGYLDLVKLEPIARAFAISWSDGDDPYIKQQYEKLFASDTLVGIPEMHLSIFKVIGIGVM